jgi:hypothetical protein
LITDANIPDADTFYVDLVRLYDGLDRDAADLISARLILTLCNHIGDPAVLREAFALARMPDTAPAISRSKKKE